MKRILPVILTAILSALLAVVRRFWKRKPKDGPTPPAAALLLLLLLSAGCCSSAPAPTPRRADHGGKLPTEMMYGGQRWTWQCEKNGTCRTVRGEAVWVGSWHWVDEGCIEVTESPVGSSWELTYRVKRQDGVWIAPAR